MRSANLQTLCPPRRAGVFLESITEFVTDARAIDQRGEGKVKAILQTPSGASYSYTRTLVHLYEYKLVVYVHLYSLTF